MPAAPQKCLYYCVTSIIGDAGERDCDRFPGERERDGRGFIMSDGKLFRRRCQLQCTLSSPDAASVSVTAGRNGVVMHVTPAPPRRGRYVCIVTSITLKSNILRRNSGLIGMPISIWIEVMFSTIYRPFAQFPRVYL
ncbi:hypothetical protein EVAR_5025_1 [Eumeta japonica]|uniref:Uncharacterized protein n=1 Tax=Eumeta variegata TaxID=151549 RepID=A0A4C1SU36_EUMVA|nr:hypothetical protein EVAR_5025_1 [Eumeta japonica]